MGEREPEEREEREEREPPMERPSVAVAVDRVILDDFPIFFILNMVLESSISHPSIFPEDSIPPPAPTRI